MATPKQIKDTPAADSAALSDKVAIDNASDLTRHETWTQVLALFQANLVSILKVSRTEKAIDYTTIAGDDYIAVTNTDTARTITLGSVQIAAGKIVIITDESGGAGTNNITIATEASEKISGEDTYVINVNYNSVSLQSDGTDWFII